MCPAQTSSQDGNVFISEQTSVFTGSSMLIALEDNGTAVQAGPAAR